MVYVGETTGRLEEIFLRLFQHLEFQEDMRDAGQVGAALSDLRHHRDGRRAGRHQPVRHPAFAKVYQGFGAQAADHHAVADRLLQLHGSSYWWLLLLGLVGAVARLSSPGVATPAGRYRWDRFKLRIPIAGKIILKATLARFARSFALAIRSGVTAVQGLTLVAQVVDNAYHGRAHREDARGRGARRERAAHRHRLGRVHARWRCR